MRRLSQACARLRLRVLPTVPQCVVMPLCLTIVSHMTPLCLADCSLMHGNVPMSCRLFPNVWSRLCVLLTVPECVATSLCLVDCSRMCGYVSVSCWLFPNVWLRLCVLLTVPECVVTSLCLAGCSLMRGNVPMSCRLFPNVWPRLCVLLTVAECVATSLCLADCSRMCGHVSVSFRLCSARTSWVHPPLRRDWQQRDVTQRQVETARVLPRRSDRVHHPAVPRRWVCQFDLPSGGQKHRREGLCPWTQGSLVLGLTSLHLTVVPAEATTYCAGDFCCYHRELFLFRNT